LGTDEEFATSNVEGEIKRNISKSCHRHRGSHRNDVSPSTMHGLNYRSACDSTIRPGNFRAAAKTIEIGRQANDMNLIAKQGGESKH